MMSFNYIRKYYGLPFLRRGGRIRYEGELGTITGTHGTYLMVRMDNRRFKTKREFFHPTWNITYLDKDGNIIKECGE